MSRPTVDRLCDISVLVSFLLTLRNAGRSRANLQLEVLALRHQLYVLKRSHARRLRLTRVDRWLWIWFAWGWQHWHDALVVVKPETIIAWQRAPSCTATGTCSARCRHGPFAC